MLVINLWKNVACAVFNFSFIFGTAGRIDKYDSSFQRSRSSSMSSLENITTETVSCLTFADSYTKKSGMLYVDILQPVAKITLVNTHFNVQFFITVFKISAQCQLFGSVHL